MRKKSNKDHNLTNITLQLKIGNVFGFFFFIYAIQSLKINLYRQDDTCYKECFTPSQNLLDLLTEVSYVPFIIRLPAVREWWQSNTSVYLGKRVCWMCE